MSRKARKHAVIIARRAFRAIPRDVERPEYRAGSRGNARKEFRAMKAAYLWGKALTRECVAMMAEKDAVVSECL
jgi:hypothetical protein